jgi:hypothetical protein
MEKGGDIIALGKNLQGTVGGIKAKLPVRIELARVTDQPKAVSASVNEFIKVLIEAVLIVLAVSFVALGLHTKPLRLDFRHDHSQLGDSDRSDRAGHQGRRRAVECNHRVRGASLPADRADRCRCSAGNDSAVTLGILGPDGGSDHGRSDRRDGLDAVVSACVICRMVQGQKAGLMQA